MGDHRQCSGKHCRGCGSICKAFVVFLAIIPFFSPKPHFITCCQCSVPWVSKPACMSSHHVLHVLCKLSMARTPQWRFHRPSSHKMTANVAFLPSCFRTSLAACRASVRGPAPRFCLLFKQSPASVVSILSLQEYLLNTCALLQTN